MVPEEFGPFLTELRKNKNMTQKQLASELNVSTAAVSKWERSLCLPEISKYEDIARVFDLSLVEVMQCKISSSEMVSRETVNDVLSESLIIAKYEKERLKQRLVRAILLIIFGFAICSFGFWLGRKSENQGIIGQADALTNIYIESLRPNVLLLLIIFLGVLFLLIGGFLFIKLIKENVRK